VKDQIIEVLKRYEGTQVNIDSQMAQNQIADEIVDNIRRRFIVTAVEDALDAAQWVKGDETFDG
tara:strand:- start:1372 stop:1563 length:192 start_codon:yes stop_codon:yes gene_type:complete